VLNDLEIDSAFAVLEALPSETRRRA
jgi:hypothetical protein